MVDKLTPEQRSENMRRIRGMNTRPELAVRRAMHAAGLRYRLHRHDLPGRPDLVFASRRACVFVHGCFWHGCPRCRHGRRAVASNQDYWTAKVARNKLRDSANARRLQELGWSVLTIWECEVRDAAALRALAAALRAGPPVD